MDKYHQGLKTPYQLISTPKIGWTPKNRRAAENIARTMGIRPDQDMHLEDPAMMARFERALATQEGAPGLVRGFAGGRRPDTGPDQPTNANVG